MAPVDISPKNFRCLSWHYYSLTCTWDPPEYYVKTSYDLKQIAYSSVAYHCPTKPNNTACTWTLSDVPPYRQHTPTMYFRLYSSNQFGDHSQNFEIDHFAILKPDKVTELIISDVTASSVELQWLVPAHFDDSEEDELYPRLVYEILVIPKDYPQSNTTLTIESKRTYNVTELIPYTPYVFSVRCKTSRAKDEQMWSEYTSVTTSTKQDGKYCFLNYYSYIC